MTVDDAVKQCRIFLSFHEMPEETLPALIAQAPDMYTLICVLLHDGVLKDTHSHRVLSRAKGIIERVTGEKRIWPDEAGEGTP